MNILSIECSASPVSVCVFDGEKILASSYINVKITHSQTLLPMIESTLKSSALSLNDISGLSVATGPGSFTGVRIGISAIKGLAVNGDLPCVPVSTLEAMAHLFLDVNAVICPVMDARCNQFYNALFRIDNGKVCRICDDRAILSNDLLADIAGVTDKIIICGDGAEKFFSQINDNRNCVLADISRRYQSAVGVAFASFDKLKNGQTLNRRELLPSYLRPPQAERELKAKQKRDDTV